MDQQADDWFHGLVEAWCQTDMRSTYITCPVIISFA